MRTLHELQSIFESYLKQQQFNRKPQELYEPFSYMLALGGKRMRPLLLLMSYEMFGKKAEDVLPQAFAIELFHNFTLIHDDIMDNASLRRGAPTVHIKYNANIAILSGDVMLVQAYEYLRQNREDLFARLSTVFSKTAIEVCEGQQIDLNFETAPKVTIDEYLEMIGLKTAVLLGASLKMGAMLAGADEATQQKLYNFGKYTGIAFQLSDDILDSYGDEEKFGKLKGGDILQNKKTILLLLAYTNTTPEQKKQLDEWLSRKDYKPEEKINAVLNLYNQTGAEGAARNVVSQYHEKALAELDGINLPDDSKKLLYDFAGILMQRQV